MNPDFVHLHLHSEYSILDGLCALERGKDHASPLMERAKELGQDAIALTDHGNLYGIIHFYEQAKKYGIKPILGCEVYVTPGDHTKRELHEGRQANHLVLLAENDEGFANLLRLVSTAHLEGMYYKPRIDRPLLAQHHKGLIALSACLKGEVAENFMLGRDAEAERIAAEYADIMGPGNFYVEIQDHGLDEQHKVTPKLLALARKLALPLIATNDVHYLRPEHKEAHEMLLCLQTQDKWSNPNRMKYGSDQFYLKSAAEMDSLFGALAPESLSNTRAIADRCNVTLKLGGQKNPHFPSYVCPDGLSHKEYLVRIASEGIRRHYGVQDLHHPKDEKEKTVADRFFHELSIIERTGFVNYFLVVWDFINAAKKMDIPVGPGRGSGAGSLVAYAMGITGLDPLRYGLIFERFLNPERVSPPDFDVDFCQTRRGEVIEYVKRKYGHENVAQIATFGTLGAKTLVRDIGRAMEFPLSECDRIAKLIPEGAGVTLASALESSKEFADECKKPGYAREIMRYAPYLEEMPRQTGTHAAGVVIGEQPLINFIPLMRDKEGSVQAQWEAVPLEEIGLLKMDFLGLKTLTVIKETVENIKATTGKALDPMAFPLDDAETYAMLARGDTTAVFQVESEGMRNLLRDLKINKIEELIAMIALYRPGPMKMIPSFIARKLGREPIAYEHPKLEPILRETYGIFVYQEQIQQAVGALAGFTMGQGDVLRRAMGKKKADVMARERENFVKGCIKQQTCDRAKAEHIFDLITEFAQYGFNKSHSAAYGIVTFQTAYLKAHYPVEFLSAMLSSEMGNTDKLPVLIADAQACGIQVLPPDVNESGLRFTPVRGTIRFGLGGVKGVGAAAVESIIAERKANGPYASFTDFCERIDTAAVNSRTVESLVKAGAFDFTGLPRGCLVNGLSTAMEHAARARSDRANGQTALFDMLGAADDSGLRFTDENLRTPDPWTLVQRLNFEREMTGFFISGHPLDSRAWILKAFNLVTADRFSSLPSDTRTRIGGLVARPANRTTKKQPPTQWISFDLETLEGTVSCAVFGDAVSAFRSQIVAGAPVMVVGSVRNNSMGSSLSVDELHPLDEVPALFTAALNLYLAPDATAPESLAKLDDILKRHSGPSAVRLVVRTAEGANVVVRPDRTVRVTNDLITELRPFAHNIRCVKIDDVGLTVPRRHRPSGPPA